MSSRHGYEPSRSCRRELSDLEGHHPAPLAYRIPSGHWAVSWRSYTTPRHELPEAAGHVANVAGLYAIYGAPETWELLGLVPPRDNCPLYVGKAERSLATCYVTHFQNGRTGRSTVRRTFAALLRQALGLSGIPRDPRKPTKLTHYGLSEDQDEKLSQWMNEKLELPVWKKPPGCADLGAVEVGVIQEWVSPLNIADNPSSKWNGMIRAARGVMAEDARKWARNHGAVI